MSGRTIYLRPSGAHAWGRCAGYAAINAGVRALLDGGDHEVREDGTGCHWLSYELAHGRKPAEGSLSPNGRELTEEMFAAAAVYLDVLRSFNLPVQLEVTMPVSSVFRHCQDGTPDAFAIDHERKLLKLPDLKYGFTPVEVWRNPQLIVYAWTILCLYPSIVDVDLIIVQPRANHRDGTVRTWRTTRDELRPLAEALQVALENAMAPNPICTVTDACNNCGGAHACTALAAAGGYGVDISHDSTPHELDEVQLGYELTKLERAYKNMEHRITGLSAQADSIIRGGGRVPGYGRERAGTRWRWRDDKHAQVEVLGRVFGVDVHAPVKLRTPAQLRHEFTGLDVQSLFAEQPTGELRLKAIDPNEAIKAFTQRRNFP